MGIFLYLPYIIRNKEGKATDGQAYYRSRVFQEDEVRRFRDIRHNKVVSFSVLHTGRLYPRENISGSQLCSRLSRSQCHIEAGKIISKKNFSDIIKKGTRDLPVCSAVPYNYKICNIYFNLQKNISLVDRRS
jgi:hypothetical protein